MVPFMFLSYFMVVTSFLIGFSPARFGSRRVLHVAAFLWPLAVVAQAPAVVRSGLAPAANARTAARTTAIVVPFSQAPDPTTVGTIRVHSAQYLGQRTATTVVSGNGVVLGLTAPSGASAAFRPGETVRVSVPATVRSAAGAATVPYVYQFTAAATGGTGSFVAPAANPNPAVGSAPTGVAVGDVDGDGDLDLCVVNFGGNSVSVRLNNGSGSFGGGSTVGVGNYPFDVALGDMDGDGDLDLLVSNSSSATVSVRFNNGSGGFSGGANVAVGNSPTGVAVGDVDGDGDLDFITANQSAVAGTVSVRLNDGAGTFTAPTANAQPAVGSYPTGVALVDVDGDGDQDLLTANQLSNSVSVRLNNGSGSFGGGSDPGVGIGPASVAVGDVDDDGDLDFVAANTVGGTVSVRLNNGSGVFSGGSDTAVGADTGRVALGDVDGDGDLDFVVTNRTTSGTVSVRLNNGTGAFTAPATNPSSAVGRDPSGVALADVDGDGDLDCVASNVGSATVSVRLNDGTPLATTLSAPLATARLWPVPARGSFTLALPSVAGTAQATVTLLNALGQAVRARTVSLLAGGTTAEYSTAGLAGGVYALRVQAGRATATLRVVVE